MDRRTSIKGLFILTITLVSSASIWKWLTLNTEPDIDYLSKKKILIAELAELIIPKTDTPGAKDAHVEDFIIGMITYCTDKKTGNNFITGLEKLEKHSIRNYDNPFMECSQHQKLEMLNYFESHSVYNYTILNKIDNKIFGKPFIIKLKELTVQGYCTSQEGATKGLAYDFIPGQFEPCIPLNHHQKSWATK
jgi:hypothetical protein